MPALRTAATPFQLQATLFALETFFRAFGNPEIVAAVERRNPRVSVTTERDDPGRAGFLMADAPVARRALSRSG